jgi:hypothetical protein
MGSTPVATNANTYISDLPDYVKPYYQMLLNASSALAFDPAFIASQGVNTGAPNPATGIPGNTGGNSGGGLGSIVGQSSPIIGGGPVHPGGGPINLDPNPGTPILPRGASASGAGLMSLGPQIISSRPSGTTYTDTGVGTTAPGAINYNPATGNPITLPKAIPMLPNGQGQIGYGPGSPSTTPGYGTGRVGPVSNPGPTGGGGGGNTGGSGGTPSGVLTGQVNQTNIGTADAVGRVIAQGRDPSVYGWSIKNPSIVPAIQQMWTQLTSQGLTGNQIASNKQFADLVAAATGTQAVNNPMIGPYAQNEYVLVPIAGTSSVPPATQPSGGSSGGSGAASTPPPLVSGTGGVSPPHIGQSPIVTRRAKGGILHLVDGGTPYSSSTAYNGSTSISGGVPWWSSPSDPSQGGGVFGDPYLGQNYGYNPYDPYTGTGGSVYNTGGGGAGTSGGGTGLATGGDTATPGSPNVVQGSYPMSAYNAYPGQRVLNPTGMFGFNALSTQPYGLSQPTQFGENQLFNQYTNTDLASGNRTFKPADLSTSNTDLMNAYSTAFNGVQNAAAQYGGIAGNPLQSTYNPMEFGMSQITVNPYQQYQTNSPMAVRPDLSGFSAANTPTVDQYPAVAYGVNPGAWVDQGVAPAYMSPYTQQVNNAQQALINRNFDEQLAQQHGSAAAAGAFGGTRSAVQDSLSNRDRQMQLDAVAAQNLNNAYNSGMGQYNADRAAIMGAGQYGLQADLANQQAAMNAQFANQQAILTGRNQAAGYDIQAQLANQNAGLNAGQFNANLASQTQNQQVQSMLQAAQANQAADLQAQGLTNQSNLSADQQRQAAWLNNQNALNANLQSQQGLIGLMNTAGVNSANNQSLQQQLDLQRLQQIQGVGATEDQRAQNILDLGYQNFVNQQNWPYQLSNYYSGILRGVPTSVNQQQFQYQTYNPAAQWAGLGLAGLGATTNSGQNTGTMYP